MADDIETTNARDTESSQQSVGQGLAAAESRIPTPGELSGDMEEYQFPSDAGTALAGEEYQGGDEYGQVPSSSTLAPGGTGAVSDRAKRLMMVVVAVLSVVIVMHFINARRAAKNASPETTAETVQIAEKEETAQVVQKQEQEVVVAQKEAVASNGRNIDSVEQNLSRLQQEYLSDQSQIHQLRNGMEHVEDFLTELQNTLAQMRTQIQVLNRKVAAMEAQNMAKKQNKQAGKMTQKKKRPLAVYHMRAAVRGRAWLQDVRGEALTIKLGDQLKDYGVVQLIDPARGMVVTSSGRTIRYAPADS